MDLSLLSPESDIEQDTDTYGQIEYFILYMDMFY